jgi:hypothetical protein
LNEADHRQAETLNRFTDAVESSKKMIESRGPESFARFRAQSCKSDVAIAFDGFFQTAQEKVDRTVVQPAQSGTIQHKRGPLNVDAILKLTAQSFLLTCI